MNRALPCGIRSRIATVTAMGALATLSALSAPAHALAAPAPTHALADSAIASTKLANQTNGANVPTSLDGLRSAQLPLPVDYRGHSSDDDDDDNYYYDY